RKSHKNTVLDGSRKDSFGEPSEFDARLVGGSNRIPGARRVNDFAGRGTRVGLSQDLLWLEFQGPGTWRRRRRALAQSRQRLDDFVKTGFIGEGGGLHERDVD